MYKLVKWQVWYFIEAVEAIAYMTRAIACILFIEVPFTLPLKKSKYQPCKDTYMYKVLLLWQSA